MEQSHSPTIDIFISHSPADKRIAEALINLLRSAMVIQGSRIRCSSVPGYELPAGVLINEHLRNEATACPIFIALATHESLKSQYVLFEMGARWGSKQNLIPLLASGMTVNELKQPIRDSHALSCDKEQDLQKLVEEIASTLRLVLERHNVYAKDIKRLQELSRREAQNHRRSSPQPPKHFGGAKDPKVEEAIRRLREKLFKFKNNPKREPKLVKVLADFARISEQEAIRLLQTMSDVELRSDLKGQRIARPKSSR